ncbi:conjugal transfer protein TrbH [Shinella curvata]|uniref:Conjugal transfer protein TrbH n=1 Tax=Shinella curvata TaxID=1817964 RepID=A0ABT8XLN6_9HYPH|nr:conjugal transfer protein TrbH [Shinella curvata]MCJ8057029.1 conjugal transfer protein TrbH [Shinella curvata]MDO6124633.1 conjugal transfer protein TrbH [Shinella curvata]
MRTLTALVLTAALASGCQSTEEALITSSTQVVVTGPAASAIAGDMASRLAERIGPAGTTSIKMENDKTDYATALEAALKALGYTVITNGKVAKDQKPVEISYSLDSFDGQVLGHLGTPSVALGRTYAVTGAGATPSSPLSVMQRN